MTDMVHIRRTWGPGYYLQASLAERAMAFHRRTVVIVVRNEETRVHDKAIASVTPDPADLIQELCRAGLWQRAGEGYEILDQELLTEFRVNGTESAEVPELVCIDAGGHRPDSLQGAVTLEGVAATCLDCGRLLTAGDPIRPYVPM